MKRGTLLAIVISVGLVVIAGIILLTLWLSGIVFTSEEVRVYEAKVIRAKAEEKQPVTSVTDKQSNKSQVYRTYDSDEEAVRSTVNAWLTPRFEDSTTVTRSENNTEFSTDMVYFGDKWKLERSKLLVPEHVEPTDQFGYCIDTTEHFMFVGAPGGNQGRVFVFNQHFDVVQTIETPDSEDTGFGRDVLCSNTGITLVIQSTTQTHIFEQSELGFYDHKNTLVSLDQNNLLLCASPDGTLWSTDLQLGFMNIHEKSSITQEWKHTHHVQAMAMNASYEPESDHVWIACAEGLQHWSMDGDTWVQNAHYLQNMPITSIDQFTAESGEYDGYQLLLIGEAQHDTFNLVNALNPRDRIDRVEIPGGANDTDNQLFADTLICWKNRYVVATSPIGHVNNIPNNGAVFIYELSTSGKLVLGSMISSSSGSAQFGSGTKIFQDTLVITSRGDDWNHAEIALIKSPH